MLLDSYRKQNRGKNVSCSGSYPYCKCDLLYFKFCLWKDTEPISKKHPGRRMAVSVYIENGTEEMAEQLKSLPYIAKTGRKNLPENYWIKI